MPYVRALAKNKLPDAGQLGLNPANHRRTSYEATFDGDASFILRTRPT